MLDAYSLVTLVSEKLQRQLKLPAMSLDLHYNLVAATFDSLTTLGTAQADIVWDQKTLQQFFCQRWHNHSSYGSTP